MKVLICDFDFFKSIGGGQSVYTSIIKKNPNINFYYFLDKEKKNQIRLPNAFGLPLKTLRFILHCKSRFDFPFKKYSTSLFGSFIGAEEIAYSLTNKEFDIIEIPDYRTVGLFLREALKKYNVKYKKLVLSLHGIMSITNDLEWASHLQNNDYLRSIEQMQYEVFDIRYGISKFYIDLWKEKTKISAEYINPINFVKQNNKNYVFGKNQKPNLYFLGRQERFKGPDIFLKMLNMVDRNLYDQAIISGSIINSLEGMPSPYYLNTIQKNRKLDVNCFSTFSQEQAQQVFASKSLIILPSRFDSFNLTGLEALLSGCPIALSTKTGLYHFLKENMSNVPFIPIDIDNYFSCVEDIKYVLKNYDEYRKKLIYEISRLDFSTINYSISKIYASPSIGNINTIKEIENLYMQLEKESKIDFLLTTKRIIGKYLPNNIKQFLKISFYLGTLKNRLKQRKFFQFLWKAFQIVYVTLSFKYAKRLKEKNKIQILDKLKKIYRLAALSKVGRVPIFNEIGRLERKINNNILAAVYDLRVMRLLGYDKFNKIETIEKELKKEGFAKEALVAKAMFAQKDKKDEQIAKILSDSYKTHLNYEPKSDYIEFFDNRKKDNYKASIIVSLYNAEEKLEKFINFIKNQTLLLKKDAELIFVETGSLKNDYKKFIMLKDYLDIPMVYAKTKQRETIQSAWNRGISLSKSDYVCFLGVDEMIISNALEILSKELDDNLDIDWIQSDSIVTEVDSNGNYVRDVMVYDRQGYKQENVYLETCYLSWVGALYRKSIHKRFGYYDSSFRGAGDTEFKNRILPYIKTKHIPKLLGIFWNYPDGQTTNSYKIEIEDLRAWYIFRTKAGVEYAFSNFDNKKLEDVLLNSLKYRKSYCTHFSTDIEYANSIVDYLQNRYINTGNLKKIKLLKKILSSYRKMEKNPFQCFRIINNYLYQKFFDRSLKHFIFFNDNRLEQHSAIWKNSEIDLEYKFFFPIVTAFELLKPKKKNGENLNV